MEIALGIIFIFFLCLVLIWLYCVVSAAHYAIDSWESVGKPSKPEREDDGIC